MNHRLSIFLASVIPLAISSLVFAQAYSDMSSLQTNFGAPVTAYSARSLGLGGTGIASQTTPDALVVNPALLAWGDGPAEALLSGTISRRQESRSYPVYDSFDAILVYNEYAMNDHLFSDANGGIRFTIPQDEIPAISLGVGTFNIYSHGYRYKEEVRDRYSSGGVIDRVLGWNRIDMDGEVRAVLLGAGVEPVQNLAVGISAGAVIDHLGNTWSVDYTSPDSSDVFVRDDFKTDGMSWMLTLGAAYRISSRVTAGLRSEMPLGKWDLTASREVEGQPLFPDLSSASYKYPFSIGWGVQYRPMSLYRPKLMLDMNWTNWSKAEINNIRQGFDDILEIRAGVEQRVFENIPVRFGAAYVPSYLDRELTLTMISLGTGYSRGAFALDVATQFGHRKYRLADPFPDHLYGGVDRTDRDQVEEWITNGLVTVTYSF